MTFLFLQCTGESSTQRGNCLNMPRTLRGQKITKKFKSEHTYFTLMIEQSKLAENATVSFNMNAGTSLL